MPVHPDLDSPPDANAPECLPPIVHCARGDLPANVALMRAAMGARERADVERSLQMAYDYLLRQGAVPEAARIGRAIELWNSSPEAFAFVKSIAAVADHTARAASPEKHVERWAGMFDAAADISPEASVALYSLGNANVLEAITDEVVDRMRSWDLLSSDRSILEIGCGIGRFARALAPAVRTFVGIDISQRMVETARARCADLVNAKFLRCSGHDLAIFPDGSFDFVCAIDVFPYLAEADCHLAAACLGEAVRVLRHDGRILILNWSYRGDHEADCSELRRIADGLDLAVVRNGTSDFDLWDGVTFLLERRSGNTVRS